MKTNPVAGPKPGCSSELLDCLMSQRGLVFLRIQYIT